MTSKDNNENGEKGGRRYLPYVFTEQGIAMLSAILRSDVAIQVSINIINAFVEMRHFFANNALLFERISNVELKQKNNSSIILSRNPQTPLPSRNPKALSGF